MKKITSKQIAALVAGIFIIAVLAPAVCSADSASNAAVADLPAGFYRPHAALPILYCIKVKKRRRRGLQLSLNQLPPPLNLIVSWIFANLLIAVSVVVFFGFAPLVALAAWLLRMWRKNRTGPGG